MIKSMTGFGKSIYDGTTGTYTCEIKTINSKSFDFNLKMPQELNFAEISIKNIISEAVVRGKIDINITFVKKASECPEIKFNREIAEAYFNILNEVSAKYFLEKPKASDIFLIPGAITETGSSIDEESALKEITAAVKASVEKLIMMRRAEGSNLLTVLETYLTKMAEYVSEIKELAVLVPGDYAERLRARIRALMGDESLTDDARLTQEVALFADKADIQEELSRIDSHLSQIKILLSGDAPCGREIDFILQELKREANTLGTKTPDTKIFNYSVALKSQIEKFREQIQNIE